MAALGAKKCADFGKPCGAGASINAHDEFIEKLLTWLLTPSHTQPSC